MYSFFKKQRYGIFNNNTKSVAVHAGWMHKNRDLAAYYRDIFPCEETIAFFGGQCPQREYVVDVVASPTYMSEPWNEKNNRMHRYCHVTDAHALRRLLVDLSAVRLNVGPVYTSVPPMSILRSPSDMDRDHPTCMQRCIKEYQARTTTSEYAAWQNAYSWKCVHSQPLECELRFDFDIKDIDCPTSSTNFSMPCSRSCGCSGNGMCRACWRILLAGAVCVDKTLDYIGMHHNSVAWFYSGNRGMHCHAARNPGGVSMHPSPDRRSRIDDQKTVGPSMYQELSMIRMMSDEMRAALRTTIAPPSDQHEIIVQRAMETYGENGEDVSSLEELIVRQCAAKQFFSKWYAFGKHRMSAINAIALQRHRFRGTASSPPICESANKAIGALDQAHQVLETAVESGSLADLLFFGQTKYTTANAPIISSNAAKKMLDSAEQAQEEVLSKAQSIVEDYSSTVDASLVPTPDYTKNVASILIAACSVICARVDTAVTDKLNHALKVPMAVHPSTGRMCIPVSRENLAAFCPLARRDDAEIKVSAHVPVLVPSTSIGSTCTMSNVDAVSKAITLYGQIATDSE